MPESVRRQLTPREAEILAAIQDLYGDVNDENSVFFSPKQEAIIFIRDQAGASQLTANLSFLAQLRDEGSTIAEIREQWLESDW